MATIAMRAKDLIALFDFRQFTQRIVPKSNVRSLAHQCTRSFLSGDEKPHAQSYTLPEKLAVSAWCVPETVCLCAASVFLTARIDSSSVLSDSISNGVSRQRHCLILPAPTMQPVSECTEAGWPHSSQANSPGFSTSPRHSLHILSSNRISRGWPYPAFGS